MNKLVSLVFVLFLLLISGYSSPALADKPAFAPPTPPGWTAAGSGASAAYFFQTETFENTKNQNGEEIASIVQQTIYPDGSIVLNKVYVRISDCDRGYGMVVHLKLDGVFLFENPWALNTATVASYNASLLCEVDKLVKQKIRNKGL